MVKQDGTPAKPVYRFYRPYAYARSAGFVPVARTWRLQLDGEAPIADSDGSSSGPPSAASEGGGVTGMGRNQAWWKPPRLF